MVEHHNTTHPEEPKDYAMKVIGVQHKPLQRQSEEASLIEEYREGKNMNRKGE